MIGAVENITLTNEELKALILNSWSLLKWLQLETPLCLRIVSILLIDSIDNTIHNGIDMR